MTSTVRSAVRLAISMLSNVGQRRRAPGQRHAWKGSSRLGLGGALVARTCVYLIDDAPTMAAGPFAGVSGLRVRGSPV